jgi:hypothetical protein
MGSTSPDSELDSPLLDNDEMDISDTTLLVLNDGAGLPPVELQVSQAIVQRTTLHLSDSTYHTPLE